MRVWTRARAAGLIACVLALPQPLRAAGGAHGVDDAAVETAGDCHLESWFSDLGHGETLLNLSPACTPTALPMLEIGAAIQHVRAPGERRWLAGPALKWTLRSGDDGGRAGVALAGAALVDTGTGRLDSAALTVPVTLAPSRRMTVNLNIGAGVAHGQDAHLLYGAQIDYGATNAIAVMAEIFGRADEPAGWQTGVRWTFDRDRMDLDLIVGRSPGIDRAAALTIGYTIRR